MSTSAPEAGLTYEGIADAVVAVLRRGGALPPGGGPAPWDSFLRLSDLVHDTYEVPSTTFTPVMRRLLFAVGFAARPGHVVGVGTYVGYTFSWLLRDRSDPGSGPFWETAVGIDTDAAANNLARRNCAALGHGDRLAFLDADGAAAVAASAGPIDLLYLDVDDPRAGKAAYRDVLAAAVPRLRPGCLVLAHDPCVPAFAPAFAGYHAFVRESGRFGDLWVLPVDVCGLSVTVAK
jgi:predicted O-methyltransferase YrrM